MLIWLIHGVSCSLDLEAVWLIYPVNPIYLIYLAVGKRLQARAEVLEKCRKLRTSTSWVPRLP